MNSPQQKKKTIFTMKYIYFWSYWGPLKTAEKSPSKQVNAILHAITTTCKENAASFWLLFKYWHYYVTHESTLLNSETLNDRLTS